MSKSLGALTLDLVAKVGGFVGPLEKADREAQKRFANMSKNAKAMGTAIGLAFSAAAAAAAVGIKRAVDMADQFNDLSAKVGIGTEALSAWGYAAKMSGVEMGTLESGLVKLNKSLAEAMDESSNQAKIFEALGVSVKNVTAEEVFPKLAQRFSEIDDAATKTKLAMELFGKSGADLLPLLNEGAGGLEEMTKRARELGVVIDTQTAQAAGEFNDRLDDLKTMMDGVFVELAGKLLPSLNSFAEVIKDPGVREGLATLITGLAKVAEVAIKSAAAVANFAKQVGEEIAVSVGGISADDLDRQRRQIAGLQKMAKDLDTGGALFGTKESRERRLAEVRADIKRLQAEYARNVEAFGPKVLMAGRDKPGPGFFRDSTAGSFDSGALDRLLGGGGSGGMARRVAATREAKKAVEELSEDEKDLIAIEEVWADAAVERHNRSVDAWLREGEAAAEAAKRLKEEADRMKSGFVDVFRYEGANAITDFLSGVKSAENALKDFFNTIHQMILRAIAENWMEKLFGQIGTTGQGTKGGDILGNLFGALFGGGKATGGGVQAGMFYRVNENGPEMLSIGGRDFLMMGNQSGHVTANHRIGRGASITQNVVVQGRPTKETMYQLERASGRGAALALRRGG